MIDPMVLVVNDATNPHLRSRMILVDGDEGAAEVMSMVSKLFPMSTASRRFQLCRDIETVEQFQASAESAVESTQERLQKQRHSKLMSYVSAVERGEIRAFVDGREIDAFELAAMRDEDLENVILSPAERVRTPALENILDVLRSMGFRVVELGDDGIG